MSVGSLALALLCVIIDQHAAEIEDTIEADHGMHEALHVF